MTEECIKELYLTNDIDHGIMLRHFASIINKVYLQGYINGCIHTKEAFINDIHK